jgi:hypothetical protein
MGNSPNLVELITIIRSLNGKPEGWRLPDSPQLGPVRGLPPVAPAPRTIAPPRSVPSPLLRPPANPLSSLSKFLVPGAIAALLGGYFVFANSHEEMNVAQLAADTPPFAGAQVEPLSARIESKVAPEVTTSLQPAVRLSQMPIETLIDESRSPQMVQASNSGHQASVGGTANAQHTKTVIEQESQTVAGSLPAYTCFSSASAVRQNQPGAWPSWTLQAPGHEGTKCWYASAKTHHGP